MEWMHPGGYWASDERTRVDISVVHRWLSTLSYWAQGRPYEVVARSIDESLPLGLYRPDGAAGGVLPLGQRLLDLRVAR